MQKVFSSNVGYVDCNICGSGYNNFTVWIDGEVFNFRRKSSCYGERVEDGLNQEQLFAVLEEEGRQFVATRYARTSLKEFVNQVKSGTTVPTRTRPLCDCDDCTSAPVDLVAVERPEPVASNVNPLTLVIDESRVSPSMWTILAGREWDPTPTSQLDSELNSLLTEG